MKNAGNLVRFTISIALILTGISSLDSSIKTINSSLLPRLPYKELINGGSVPVVEERSRTRVREAYGKLPMRFEANAGQTDAEVKFLSRGSGYSLFLTQAEAVLALSKRKSKTEAGRQSVVRMKFGGANPEPQLEGADALPGKSNYLIGNDPGKWRQNVANYEKVRYRSVYPGIDLVYYGNQGQLEYDFVVAAGADPNAIKLDFDGVEQIRLDEGGDLVLNTGGGEVRQTKPVTYQEVDGRRQEIASQYLLAQNGEVVFKVGQYDRSLPLVIDPVLSYATFLGGSDNEEAEGIAVDAAGNAYVSGYTYSMDFPTRNPIQAGGGGFSDDAFVVKLNPDGSDLVFSTYLGGNNIESDTGIVLDEAGNIYVAGLTGSDNFPTVNPIQPARAGFADVFVAKLNGNGSALIFSTYLGGGGIDKNGSLKLDSEGDILITGITASTNFPTVNAFQPAHAPSIVAPCPGFPFPCIRFPYVGNEDAFVAKLKGDGSALVFSTYLGGSRGDDAQDLAIDGNGDITVIGVTGSTDFPTANPLQAANAGPETFNNNTAHDAFVTKFNANGALVYSTYLGGNSNDFGNAISRDQAGNVYLLGRTNSPNFPTVAPLKSTLSGTTDLFVAKLNRTGSAIIYSTYLGGNSFESGEDLKVDAQGNAYITGYTESTDFPTVNAIQPVLNPGGPCEVVITPDPLADVIVAKLNASGSSLVFSTFIGGSCIDVGTAIEIDSSGNAYVAGWTISDNFPSTPMAFQKDLTPYSDSGRHLDAFILKIGN
jgi:Beta-propeller repeat